MTTALRAAVAAAEADAGLGTVNFMTFTDVEIAHVGMEWQAASGTHTITLQHLADAVAAYEDPHILPPRLKIGHEDPRFNEDPPVHDPFVFHGPLREDGNPVYGKVENLRLAEDGMVLIGDYVEVPEWLGNSLPSSYPSRSLEGDWDIKTQGGKTYSFVITAVALLGEPLPAITCLEDLVRELTGGPAAVLEQTPVTLRKEPLMPPVSAEASTDSIRGQFWDEFAVGDRYWWWPVEIRVEDAWILCDDDEGHLYRVPVTTDADGIAAFGEPVAGVLDFREIPDPEAGENEPVAAGRVRFSTPMAAGRPKDRVRAGTATDERSDVDISTLREKLDLPDATDDEVIAAAMDALPEPSSATEDVPDPAAVAEPIAASNDKTVVVDREQFTAMQRDSELGRKAHLKQVSGEADKLVDDAIRAGRIAPASASAWRTAILPDGKDELVQTEVAALAALESGRISVKEHGGQPTIDTADRVALSAIGASFGSSRDWGKGQ
jgi:hypothetical protein